MKIRFIFLINLSSLVEPLFVVIYVVFKVYYIQIISSKFYVTGFSLHVLRQYLLCANISYGWDLQNFHSQDL